MIMPSIEFLFFKFENAINYYIYKSIVTFQPCKITMTLYYILQMEKLYCNICYILCDR